MSLQPDSPGKRRPTSQSSHDADAFDAYRAGLDETAIVPVPRLHAGLLLITIVALAATIPLTFAPWLEYQREDGSVGHASGARGDGLVLIVASVVAIIMLIVASRQEPGHGNVQALIAFGASIVGAIAVLVTLMSPEFIHVDEPELPVSYARSWGLYLASTCAALGAIGAFRLWRTADHF